MSYCMDVKTHDVNLPLASMFVLEVEIKLVRDPKTTTHTFSNEKVQWNFHNAHKSICA
jgi:hypothetical protein